MILQSLWPARLLPLAWTSVTRFLNGITKANISKLQLVQNKLARVVCKAPYPSSASCLLRKLHWLLISERIDYKIASITYRARLYKQPKYIHELLTNYQPVRSLRSSNCNLLVVPSHVKTVTASRAFCVAAPKLWNSLPPGVTSAESFYVFKSRLKSHLFNIAFNYSHLESGRRLCLALSELWRLKSFLLYCIVFESKFSWILTE